MRIIDQDGNPVENPDLSLGRLVRETKNLLYKYEITQYEQGHYETIAEYENGGKDIEWKVDVPEKGNWIAYDEEGNETDTDIIIPDDMPHELEVPAEDAFYRYIPYTKEELAEIEEQKRLQEEAEQKQAEQQAFLEAAPSYFAALTSAFGEVE